MQARSCPVSALSDKADHHLWDMSNYLPNMNTRPFDLADYAARHRLSRKAIEYIEHSLKAPSISPNGYASSTIRHPNLKTHQTNTCHSKSGELPLALMGQTDPGVEFMVDQPDFLSLSYISGDSRVTIQYPPDFLFLWREKAPEILEYKPAGKLAELCLTKPGRYQDGGNGYYRSKPAEDAAAALGLTFRIVSSRNIHEQFIQNVDFLQSYHRWELAKPVTEEEFDVVKGQIEAQPGITFDRIELGEPSRRADVLYRLIAQGRIFTHLSDEPLKNQNRVELFLKPIQERAFLAFYHASAFKSVPADAFPYQLAEGVRLIARRKTYTVVTVGADFVILAKPDGSKVRFSIQALIDWAPRVDAIGGARRNLSDRISLLSDVELNGLLKRQAAIAPFLPAGARAGQVPEHRTVRRWLDQFKEAEARFGLGIHGIIPRTAERGNRKRHLPADIVDIIERMIEKYYLRPSPRPSIRKLHRRVKRVLRFLGKAPIPGYRTVVRECAAIDRYLKNRKRFGDRFARKERIPFSGRSPLGSPHGQRSWDVAHADHTQLDLALDHPDKAKYFEKPWHTKLIDAFDKRVLAWVTSLQSPRTDTLIALLQNCVRRHQTLPTRIVVDWGPDFRSNWLRSSLAHIGITLEYRRKSDPVAGSPVETSFSGDNKRYVHGLSGSTAIMKHAREVSAAVHPRNFTIWTLKDLEEVHEKRYHEHNNEPHLKMRCSPNEREKNTSAYLGQHPQMCLSLELLRRILLPFVDRTKRKVSPRGTIQARKHTYSHPDLAPVREKEVEVRYDPGDPGVIYVSHPTLPGLVQCNALDDALKYAQDRFAAQTVLAHTDPPLTDLQNQIEEQRSELDSFIEAKEAKLRRRKRKPILPSPKNIEGLGDNVVGFEPTQGGMMQIAQDGEDQL
jgi:putative transposase